MHPACVRRREISTWSMLGYLNSMPQITDAPICTTVPEQPGPHPLYACSTAQPCRISRIQLPTSKRCNQSTRATVRHQSTRQKPQAIWHEYWISQPRFVFAISSSTSFVASALAPCPSRFASVSKSLNRADTEPGFGSLQRRYIQSIWRVCRIVLNSCQHECCVSILHT